MEETNYIPRRKHRGRKRRFVLPILLLSCVFFFGLGKVSGAILYALGTDVPAADSGYADDIVHTGEQTEVPGADSSYANDIVHTGEQAEEPEDWALLLVNPWNKLPENYSAERTALKNGHSIDARAYPALQEMMDDARAQGLSFLICSSYRTMDKQTELFQNKVNELLASGYSQTEAEKEAANWVAVPGTSEHHTGLALDIVSVDNQRLEKSQEDTPEQKWLMENSWKYGFILRYPEDKTDITGVGYEPWHYRYVGKEAAKDIYEKSICLEEYLQQN